VVGLNRSTFYNNKHHVPSDGEIRRLLLSDVIAKVHAQSRHTYGKRRVRAALAIEHSLIVNAKLVSKLMRELQIQGLPRHKRLTRNLVNIATHDDLVERNFVADRPNALWLTDITEHPTREAKVYCCCVLDIYSRKVVGWAIDRRCETALVNDALTMAAQSRAITSSTVIHSDHGSQGEFNRLSQHPMTTEVLDGSSSTRSGSSKAAKNEIAGSPTAAARSRTALLVRNCQRLDTRRSGFRRRCISTGWATPVP